MSPHFARLLVVVALVAAPIVASDASARTMRRSCRDGVLAQRSSPDVSCDVDGRCDGVCSFSVPVCDASTCRNETVTVPAHATRRERVAVETGAAPRMVVLRCRAPRTAECITITVTTTTGMTSTTGVTTTTGATTTTRFPHPPAPTTSTTRGLVNASSSTSSTTTSTSIFVPSSTSTSIVPIPCGTDADCDGLATACAVGVCRMDGLCAQTCVCVTPDLDRTCALEEATPCLTPDDCPGLGGGVCRVCYLNLCVTAPAPACFF